MRFMANNDEFSRVLHQQMEWFSSNPDAGTISGLNGETVQVGFYTLTFSYMWVSTYEAFRHIKSGFFQCYGGEYR